MTIGRPQIFVIAGPNGAGKTTFALEFLPNEASCPRFVNADLIAAGLSPFDPDDAAVAAGRILLQRLDEHFRRGESFAFETTLSGSAYARRIRRWRAAGYEVNLLFLSVAAPAIAVERVRQRVLEGGHGIPEAVIRRRFDAGRRNFEALYRGLVDRWFLYDNSGAAPVLVDSGARGGAVNDKTAELAARIENDPMLKGIDAALRRAAAKAQARARALQASRGASNAVVAKKSDEPAPLNKPTKPG